MATKRGKGSPFYRDWTDFEVDMIIHPSRPSDRELAAMLNRSLSSVQQKRFYLRWTLGVEVPDRSEPVAA